MKSSNILNETKLKFFDSFNKHPLKKLFLPKKKEKSQDKCQDQPNQRLKK